MDNKNTDRQDARASVINYIRSHQVATVPDLSNAMALTRANIRYHIKNLLAAGVIEEIDPKTNSKGDRGRPRLFYRLALAYIDNNIVNLCEALLRTLLRDHNQDEIDKQLKVVAHFILDEKDLPTQPFFRLNWLAGQLNLRSYRSRWEAGPKGPRMVFHNCPYATLISNYPELCKIDQNILEHILCRPVRQITRKNIHGGKPEVCVFEID